MTSPRLQHTRHMEKKDPTVGHTPGPHHANEGDPTMRGLKILSDDGREIGMADFSTPSDRALPSIEEARANVRLWSQAPTLKAENEAMRQVLQDIADGNYNSMGAISSAREVLATLTK